LALPSTDKKKLLFDNVRVRKCLLAEKIAVLKKRWGGDRIAGVPAVHIKKILDNNCRKHSPVLTIVIKENFSRRCFSSSYPV
jgi:hypothetical protein